MMKIVLLGAGNVATHLFKVFQNAPNVEVVQVYNRSKDPLKDFASEVDTTASLDNLKAADIYVVSVSDDAVKPLIEKFSNTNELVVHTSGSVPLLTSVKRNGVFYPLQTFSKHQSVDFSQIPLCIEAFYDIDMELLRQLGKAISPKVYRISSEKRKSLHLAAVFACNFPNHLYRIAEKICTEKGIPFEILHPLILETAQKIQTHSPKKVQTGPAKRDDRDTIDFHLGQLDSSELKEIYTLLTRSIQEEDESEL